MKTLVNREAVRLAQARRRLLADDVVYWLFMPAIFGMIHFFVPLLFPTIWPGITILASAIVLFAYLFMRTEGIIRRHVYAKDQARHVLIFVLFLLVTLFATIVANHSIHTLGIPGWTITGCIAIVLFWFNIARYVNRYGGLQILVTVYFWKSLLYASISIGTVSMVMNHGGLYELLPCMALWLLTITLGEEQVSTKNDVVILTTVWIFLTAIFIFV